MRRAVLALVLVTLLIVLGVGAAGAWLVFTPTGARWLVSAVVERSPRIEARVAGGTLWRGLRLEKVSWDSSARTMHVRAASVVLRWRPDCLLHSLVCVDRLAISGLDVSTAPSAGDSSKARITLPQFNIPLRVRVGDLALSEVHINTDGKAYVFSHMSGSGSLVGSTLRLQHVDVEMTQPRVLAVSGAGTLHLRDGYPLAASVKLSLPGLLDASGLRADADLGGSMRRLTVDAHLTGAVALNASGWVQPLIPSPEFDVALTWSRLSWPLAGHPGAVFEDGRLQLTGNLKQIALQGRARITGANVPKGQVTLSAETDLHRLRILSLEDRTLGGTLRLRGSVAWGGGLRWEGRLDLSDINPGVRWPAYRGKLAGSVRGNGRLERGNWSLDVVIDRLGGSLAGFPASVQGEVRKTATSPWRLSKVRLKEGRNEVLLSGAVGESWDVRGHASIERIEALWPKLKGRATANVKVSGPLKRPDVDINVVGHSLTMADMEVGRLTLDGRVAGLGRLPSRLSFSLSDVAAPRARFSQIDGRLAGTLSKHRLTLLAKGQPISFSTELTGSLSARGDWAGKVSSARVGAYSQHWVLVKAFRVAWRSSERQARVASNCWAQGAARLCLSAPGPVGRTGTARLELEHFPVSSLSPWMPKAVRWDGSVAAHATVQWSPGQRPAANMAVQSENGTLTLRDSAEATPLVLHYTRIAVAAQLGTNAANVRLELASKALGQARVDLQVQPRKKPMPLGGDIRLDRLRVDLLAPFFPKLQTLSGYVSAKGRLEGTLDAPRFVGRVTLEKGRVVADALALNLKDIAFRADVSGSRAVLSGSFASGGGQAKLTGDAEWSVARWRLALKLKGTNLAFRYPPEVKLEASPDLSLVAVPGRIDLTGRIDIPNADIKLRKLPEQAVAISDDVVIVNAPQDHATKPPAGKALAKWNVNTSIAVVLGEDVKFSGFGLTGRLNGNLNLRQLTDAVPSATGEIRVVDGRYQAYGQKLTIRRGRLLFSGPVDQPSLDVEAVRQINTIVAGIRVTGRPDSPQVSLFSEPAMSQNDILSYLLRGQPASAGGGNKDATLAQAALALGAYGGKDITTALANKLGVKDLTLDSTGNGTQTQFVVGGYLSPKLYLSYGVGVFQPMNTFTLRYTLTRKLYVQATSGLQSAIDIFYTFDF